MDRCRESDLLGRARAGDSRAFALLVERTRSRIMRVVSRLADSDHDADDIVQETFIQAWRSIGSFRGNAAFASWIHRIAVNAAAMHRRAARRRPDRGWAVFDGEAAAADRASAPLADELLERKQSVALLREAFQLLPGHQRSLLSLRYLEESTNAEVAGILAIPRSYVRSRLVRARSRVRQHLARMVDTRAGRSSAQSAGDGRHGS